eukprot:1155493-Pelagomonas_calceolata.AAC.3
MELSRLRVANRVKGLAAAGNVCACTAAQSMNMSHFRSQPQLRHLAIVAEDMVRDDGCIIDQHTGLRQRHTHLAVVAEDMPADGCVGDKDREHAHDAMPAEAWEAEGALALPEAIRILHHLHYAPQHRRG